MFGLDRLQRGLDAERLQQTDDFGSDRLVDPQTAEGNAAISSVVHEAPLAMIAADLACRAAVGDMQFAAAMTAAQEAGPKPLTTPDGAARPKTFGVGVIGDQALPIPIRTPPMRDILRGGR